MTAMKEVTAPPATFRVLFSDGESEIDIGKVAVDPGLAFKKFQFVVSDMVGVSPHQIALSLIRQKKGRLAPGVRRRTPIDEGTDFGALSQEKDCVVLAHLMKRTRRDRRGRGRRSHASGGGGDEFAALEKSQALVPEKTILRRPAEFYGAVPALAAAMVPAAENGSGLMGLFNYEGLRNLQLQRERYLLSTAAAALYPYAGSAVTPAYVRDPPRAAGLVVDVVGPAVCGVCVAAREKPAPFHCCVYDRVLAEGFRSSVGPIERPPKARVQTPA